MKKSVSLCCILLSGVCLASTGAFRFNRMYSSHMVLQRGEPLRISGFAGPGREVTVFFNAAEAHGRTSADGCWRVTLPASAAGGPFALVATDGAVTNRLEDVMVGDVWFCTGQSNMWWPLKDAGEPEKEIAAADHPNIRLLDVALTGAEEETDEPPYVRGWSRCTPVSARNFSACAYHFARTLREKLGDVPIGLIGAGWGGPPISHFLPPHPNLSTNYLAKSRAARDAAAIRFATEDRLREKCRALFEDGAACAKIANEPVNPAHGGEVELPAKKGLEHGLLEKFSGLVHFQKSFVFSSPHTNIVLSLGASALPGRIYVNGREIGSRKNWNSPVPGAVGTIPWRFTVPKAVLQSGTNRIDVLLACNDRLTWWGAFSGEMSASLSGLWRYEKVIDIPLVPRTYGGSWGARIHPFFAMNVKGVLFYQGETDSRRPCAAYLADHRRFVSLLREGWGKADLPYYCMQLANFSRKRSVRTDNGFCEIREAQRLTSEELSCCGTAVSIDLGEDTNIHPKNKREQGPPAALFDESGLPAGPFRCASEGI